MMQMGFPTMLAGLAGATILWGTVNPSRSPIANEATGALYAGILETPKELQQVAADDLEQRGKELRAQLYPTYRKLADSRKLSGAGTDITEAVLPYIPIGTPFPDAEIILRNAGFTVGPHPDLNTTRRGRDWYAVVARISPFTSFIESFPFKVSVYVELLPKSPVDYTTVESVSAALFVSGP